MTMPRIQKVSPGERDKMIAEAAYFRAEQRGFKGGDPLADWVQAEAEINARLSLKRDSHLLDTLEQRVATASGKLKALRKRVSGMKADVRREWQVDVDRLAELRNSLAARLGEIQERGEHATRKAQKQAEKIWEEIADIVQRTSPRRRK
jgi:chromosome segregation ATPase